jgi:MtaA/CmuA family methyltransferase
MNSTERVTARLRGLPVDRVPNFDIVMAWAARLTGKPLSGYYLDARVLVEANLRARERCSLDILQAISDPYREAVDFGQEVEFPHDSLPLRRAPLLENPEDLARLRRPDPSAGRRMSDRLEAVRLMKERSAGDVPVMGWVEGALAEANVLRGDTALMMDLYDRPEWVEELLERCVEVAIAFARAQVEAGADIIGLGDAIASQVSPAMYEEFALPCEKRIFDAVHAAGALARLHICGDTSRLLRLMARSGADIVDVDWMVNLGDAAAEFSGHATAPCGNFDPVRVLLNGTEAEVVAAVASNLSVGGPMLISAAGCEVPEGTPEANLRARLVPLGPLP